MTEKEISKLIKIADILDKEGNHVAANIIDKYISSIRKKAESPNEIQEVEIEIPEDEKNMLDEILESLRYSLE